MNRLYRRHMRQLWQVAEMRESAQRAEYAGDGERAETLRRQAQKQLAEANALRDALRGRQMEMQA